MDDTIYRQAAIDVVRKCSVKEVTPAYMLINKAEVMTELMMLPSAQPRRGKWAGKGDSEGFGIFVCDNCGKFAMMKYDFCPNCGADMRTKETDCDYERAVEQLEHDMLYEPTFNQDDGSM